MQLKPSYLVIGILAGLALYGLGRHEARLSREAANWKQAAESALAANKPYQLAIDSLRGLERAARARETLLKRDLARLGRTADSLTQRADSLSTFTQPPEQLGPYRQALVASQAVVATCRATLAVADSGWTSCQVRASLAEHRAAHLDSLLRVGLKVQSCRIGFLPCPSRGVVLAGGLLGGFLLGRR